jgi:hypothetical protein
MARFEYWFFVPGVNSREQECRIGDGGRNARDVVRQSRAVGHQIPDEDRGMLAGRVDHTLNLWKVERDRIVEPEFPGIAQLEQRQTGDDLVDRTDAIDGVLVDRLSGGQVANAVPVRPDEVPVVYDAHRQSRNARLVKVFLELTFDLREQLLDSPLHGRRLEVDRGRGMGNPGTCRHGNCDDGRCRG